MTYEELQRLLDQARKKMVKQVDKEKAAYYAGLVHAYEHVLGLGLDARIAGVRRG